MFWLEKGLQTFHLLFRTPVIKYAKIPTANGLLLAGLISGLSTIKHQG